MYRPTLIALALAACANAITVETPQTGDTWESGNSQTVEWKAVSTDPTSFSIQLVNQVGRVCALVALGRYPEDLRRKY